MMAEFSAATQKQYCTCFHGIQHRHGCPKDSMKHLLVQFLGDCDHSVDKWKTSKESHCKYAL